MRSYVRAYALGAVVASCVLVGAAPPSRAADSAADAGADAQPRSDDAFVAVLALGAPSDAARRAARAVYRSRLRPPELDEESARALVGDLPAGTGGAGARELAELRDGVRGEDAASRQVLAAIGRRLKLKGILVVTGAADARPTSSAVDAGASSIATTDGGASPIAMTDGGASPVADLDAGAASSSDASALEAQPTDAGDVGASTVDPERALRDDARLPSPAAAGKARARLFHVGLGSFDAATYGADDTTGWGSTVASLERLFPAPGYRKYTKAKEETPSKPFYTSPWFCGGLGAALLFGGAFYFASRDSGGDTIHLQMKVP